MTVQALVRCTVVHTILTKDEKLGRGGQTKERGFQLLGVAHSGEVSRKRRVDQGCLVRCVTQTHLRSISGPPGLREGSAFMDGSPCHSVKGK